MRVSAGFLICIYECILCPDRGERGSGSAGNELFQQWLQNDENWRSTTAELTYTRNSKKTSFVGREWKTRRQLIEMHGEDIAMAIIQHKKALGQWRKSEDAPDVEDI